MNATMSPFMQRTIFSLVFGICLVMLGAADASAHQVEYRPFVVHDSYVHSRIPSLPRWLRRDREFRRWYWHSHYRFRRHLSWHRLYDIYRFESRHRWHGRRIYDKVYRYHGHRSYYPKPNKHRH